MTNPTQSRLWLSYDLPDDFIFNFVWLLSGRWWLFDATRQANLDGVWCISAWEGMRCNLDGRPRSQCGSGL